MQAYYGSTAKTFAAAVSSGGAGSNAPAPAVAGRIGSTVGHSRPATRPRKISEHLLRGVTVKFPYEPYEVQLLMMERMMEALQTGQNALLESPTGTGKTLCLLSAAICWQASYADALRMVWSKSTGIPSGDLGGLDEARILAAAGKVYQPSSAIVNASAGAQSGVAGLLIAGAPPSVTPGAAANAFQNERFLYADGTAPAGTSAPLSRDAAVMAARGSVSPARAPLIIYASRTHSQLSQVVRELKALGLPVNISVLGSRDQLCVHPLVSKQNPAVQNYACRGLIRGRKCYYKLQLDELLEKQGSLGTLLGSGYGARADSSGGGGGASGGLAIATPEGGGGGPTKGPSMASLLEGRGGAGAGAGRYGDLAAGGGGAGFPSTAAAPTSSSFRGAGAAAGSRPPDPVLDIEELHAAGAKHSICSYFYPRAELTLRRADLLIIPYNFLVDSAVRAQTLAGVRWQDAVVIVDEAHNIEEVCSEAASFDLTAGDIARCVDELKTALLPFFDPDTRAFVDPATGNAVPATPEAEAAYQLSMFKNFGFRPADASALRSVLLGLEAVIDQIALHPERAAGPYLTADGEIPWYNRPSSGVGAAVSGVSPWSGGSGGGGLGGGGSGAAGNPLSQLDARVEDGTFLYRLLEEHHINGVTKPAICQLIDAVVLFLSQRDAIAGAASGTIGASAGGRASYALESIRTILDRLFKDEDAGAGSAGGAAAGGAGVGAEEGNAAFTASVSQHYRCVIYTPGATGGFGGTGGRPRSAADSLLGGGAAGGGRKGRTLSYWCFSPGVAMRELSRLGVRSIVLASGTLSPMNSYAAELQLPFPVRLENPHVVEGDQVLVAVLKRGVTGKPLNSAYEHRDKPEYKRELGCTIANIARLVPDGVLVFFPSYSALDTCVSFWKADNGGDIWSRLTTIKAAVVVEPRGSAGFGEQIRAFNDAVATGKGALMLGVCRGKVSEGVDFADANGRAVIVTGLPYPPKQDPKVALKRQYLDVARAQGIAAGKSVRSAAALARSAAAAAAKGGKAAGSNTGVGAGDGAAAAAVETGITGGEWYHQKAYRAVNQAIGRVIRHRHDYGAILLLDERFERDCGHLSAWLRPRVHVFEDPAKLLGAAGNFFRAAAYKAGMRDAGALTLATAAGGSGGAGTTAAGAGAGAIVIGPTGHIHRTRFSIRCSCWTGHAWQDASSGGRRP